MTGRVLAVMVVSGVCLGAAWTQVRAQDSPFSLVLHGNFTTGSQLFPHANSHDPFDRAESFVIEDILGLGVELRYQFSETNIAVGLSTDYVRALLSQNVRGIAAVPVPVEDGFSVIPVELTGYFLIPVAGPSFGLYMGGGGGAYFGRRILRVAGVEAVPVDEGHGFGIHVLAGCAYAFTDWFSLNAEMKFRDVQFSATNAYTVSHTVYNGATVTLSQVPEYSRVHADGVVFQLGAPVHF